MRAHCPSLRQFAFIASLVAALTVDVCEAQLQPAGEWTPDFCHDEGVSFPYVLRHIVARDGAALYAGGNFATAGSVTANRIARWNGERWATIGEGLHSTVRALAEYEAADGLHVYAGGDFGVARWEETRWRYFPLGPNGRVETLAVFDDGTGPALYAGGRFTQVWAQWALNAARWDGQTWSPLPGEILDVTVLDFEVFDDGSGPALFAAGENSSSSSSDPNTRIAKWTAAGWESVARVRGTSTNPVGQVLDLAVHDDGSGPRLCAAGVISEIEGQQLRNVASFDGQSWVEIGAGGLHDIVSTIASYDDGHGARLYAAGRIYLPRSVADAFVVVWDGTAWSPTGRRTNGRVEELAVYDVGDGPRLAAGGGFDSYDGTQLARGLATWDGTNWAPLRESGVSGGVVALTVFDDGNGQPAKLVGGCGRKPWDEYQSPSVSWWDGRRFHPLGSQVDGFVRNHTVQALETLDFGEGPTLLLGGRFTSIGSRPIRSLARWGGDEWQPMGEGFEGPILAFEVLDTGAGPELYAGGNLGAASDGSIRGVARWNGDAWRDVGSGLAGLVNALEVFDVGAGPELYAGGSFFDGGVRSPRFIARLRSGVWEPVGGGLPDIVKALAVHDDGSGPRLYASGRFGLHNGPFDHIARFDGNDWESVGQGLDGDALSLVSFDDGTGSALYAGGLFRRSGALDLGYVARWNGAAWEPLAGGVDFHVYDLQPYVDADGPSLYVGGGFEYAGGAPSLSLARWRDPVAAVLLGSVGARTGSVEDVLFVNDSNTRSWRSPLPTYVPR